MNNLRSELAPLSSESINLFQGATQAINHHVLTDDQLLAILKIDNERFNTLMQSNIWDRLVAQLARTILFTSQNMGELFNLDYRIAEPIVSQNNDNHLVLTTLTSALLLEQYPNIYHHCSTLKQESIPCILQNKQQSQYAQTLIDRLPSSGIIFPEADCCFQYHSGFAKSRNLKTIVWYKLSTDESHQLTNQIFNDSLLVGVKGKTLHPFFPEHELGKEVLILHIEDDTYCSQTICVPFKASSIKQLYKKISDILEQCLEGTKSIPSYNHNHVSDRLEKNIDDRYQSNFFSNSTIRSTHRLDRQQQKIQEYEAFLLTLNTAIAVILNAIELSPL